MVITTEISLEVNGKFGGHCRLKDRVLAALLIAAWLGPALAGTPRQGAALDVQLGQREADPELRQDDAADAGVRLNAWQEELASARGPLLVAQSVAEQQVAACATERATLRETESEVLRLQARQRQSAEALAAAEQAAAAKAARLRAQIAELRQLADQQAGELDTLGIARLQLSQERKQLNATLTEIRGERDRLAQELAAAQQDKATLEAKLKDAQQRLGVAEQALATTPQKLNQLQQAIAGAYQSNREILASRAQLERRLTELEGAATDLKESLANLSSSVPVALGAGVMPAELQARARRHAEVLRSAYRAWQVDRANQDLQARLRQAEKDLHNSQLQLSRRLAQGLGVHRLLPHESLSVVALAKYGSMRQWRKIYDANAHIIDDPDQVLPGITIVLP